MTQNEEKNIPEGMEENSAAAGENIEAVNPESEAVDSDSTDVKDEEAVTVEAEEKEEAEVVAEEAVTVEAEEKEEAEVVAEEAVTVEAEEKEEAEVVAEEAVTVEAEEKEEAEVVAEEAVTVEAEEKEEADVVAEEAVSESAGPDFQDEEPVKIMKAVKEKSSEVSEKSDVKGSVSPDDFDWDEFEKSDNKRTRRNPAHEALYDETLSSVVDNELVEGIVIQMTTREVVVNIGYKSEGVISLNEFRYNPDLKIGDKVELYVESKEDKRGQLVLSHKKARSMKSWDRVNAALENDEIITGYIKCRTKGGMIVDVFGIEAFLPGSQIDVKPIRDYDVYVGKTMEFKVVKINQEFKNVVVSHKALIEAELELQKKEIISKLEKGQILEGTVKNITSYGVFIDLGGVDGLVHITDLSWGRVNHPEEIVELDQKLNVVILDFDDDKKRIALGLKQLTPHPWDSIDPDLKVGDKVTGKVVVMADYGAFVEVATGVEGLIHVSEMSWSQHLRSAQEFMKVGDMVEAEILTLDKDDRKMSLGIKQLKTDPWENIDDKYTVGSSHKARVRNFTNFGVFVEIEEGVDGLIHISDLSWTKKIKHPAEFTAIDAEIEVVVLEIDKDNRRLSLGHKQLEENPWDVFETIFSVDSVHEGTITELFDKGAVIALPYGVEGFVTPKHLVKEDASQAKIEDKLMFKVIEFNKNSKKIIVSHSRTFEDEREQSDSAGRKSEADATRKATRKLKSNLEKTTLGDISELAALKEEMEEKENKASQDQKK